MVVNIVLGCLGGTCIYYTHLDNVVNGSKINMVLSNMFIVKRGDNDSETA